DLLVVYLIQGRQPAPEPFPKLWEPLRERALAREAPHRADRTVVFVGDQRHQLVAYPGVGDQLGVRARDVEIHVRERLLRLVHDQAEQAAAGEHALEQRRAICAAHLEEGGEPGPDPVPARDTVAVLGPGEYPRDGAQVAERARAEPARGARADVEQRDLLERARRLEVRGELGMLDQPAIGGVRRAG